MANEALMKAYREECEYAGRLKYVLSQLREALTDLAKTEGGAVVKSALNRLNHSVRALESRYNQ